MKLIKITLITLILMMAKNTFAQVIDDPTTWTYDVKKKSATDYQLIFHLNIKDGWHIWSLHPGGDGYEISPSFAFDKNDKVKLKGAATEKGKATTTKMEGIDGKITYLAGKIDYIQEVIVTGGTKITGKHTYQVCNDKLCLPPKDKDFVFEIK
jgi:cytochrome c biogenesis DsbD-like protein